MSQTPAKIIESPSNPRFKLWESLLEGRGIRKHGQFLLAGRKLVPEALRLWPGRFQSILFCGSGEAPGLALQPGLERVALGRSLFERLDILGTGAPLLVGRLPELEQADLTRPPEGLELVCALGDPVNLGALIRSAVAFGVRHIVLLDGAAHPFHPRCSRAGANAQFQVRFSRGGDWAELAKAAGPLVALDLAGRDLSRFSWPRDLRLVLGEEGQGLPAGLAAERLAIPMAGQVESLNATVAASLALYAYFVSRR